MMTTRENPTIWEALRESFDDRLVGTMTIDGRPVKYLNAQAVEGRFDAVLGPANWNASYQVLHDSLGAEGGGALVVECTISVNIEEERDESLWMAKTEVGESSGKDGEVWKAAYSDAFKRAGRRWGVGRYLAFV